MSEEKQDRYDKAYLRMAAEWGKLSYCKRKQVGAIIVKDRMIISDGYNGTPTGFENYCEDEEVTPNGMFCTRKPMPSLRSPHQPNHVKGLPFILPFPLVKSAASLFINQG